MIQVQANGNGEFTIPALGVAPQWVLMWQRRGTEESNALYVGYLDFTVGKYVSLDSDIYGKISDCRDFYVSDGAGGRVGDIWSYVKLTAEVMKNTALYVLWKPTYFYENSMIWVLYQ